MAIKIALIGNPNSGKTTLFNALTGSKQYVGNWPGVTVDKKSGRITGHAEAEIVDLPGIYSLAPYSPEEIVARDFLTGNIEGSRPDAILNIVDGTNLERNLFLTTQLLELGIPTVLAVNMMDAVEKKGGGINVEKLAEELGCVAAGISALKNQGVKEIAETAVNAAKSAHKPASSNEGTPPSSPLKNFLNNEERYAYINAVLRKCADGNTAKSHGPTMSDKIDRIVTHRFFALPIFAAVMSVMYFVSVTTVGAIFTGWVNDGVFGDGFGFFGVAVPGVPVVITNFIDAIDCAAWIKSLVVDGIVAGVGAVLGFVPQLVILFMFLAFLEGCGYMARAAFIMDRFFRKLGLSGKSFIPFLVGSGCTVPAVLSARTIESGRERRMTVLTAPFIPCSAKLPVIAMISGAVFGGAWWVAPSAYFAGIAAAACSGLILKKTPMLAGRAAPFIMELPAYRLPGVKSMLRSTWERTRSFVKKAGTVILGASVVIWFAMGFGFDDAGFRMVANWEDCLLAGFGRMFAWVFAPLGWGNWQFAVATLTGLVAKETIVGTLGILYDTQDGMHYLYSSHLRNELTTLGAYSFMLFNLLCMPCVAAVAAIRTEMGKGIWFWFAITYQTVFAYAASMCVYQIGTAFSGDFGLGTAAAILLLIGFLYLILRPVKNNEKI